MATVPLQAESACANPLTFTLSPGMAPAAPLMRMLARFDRAKVEAFAEISIALLDLMEPDPENEDNGDLEPSGDEEDSAWIEWHTMRGNQKGGPNSTGHDLHGNPLHEDTEEDDDPGQCTEDEISTLMGLAHGYGAGCKISDPGEHEDGL